MPNAKKTAGKSPYITAAIHSATGAGLVLFPGHVVRFSSTPGSRNILTEDNDLTISILNNTIDVVTVAKEFVGINVVKGALSGVIAILIIVRDTKSNNSALADLAVSCADTCMVLKRGMVGKTEEEISPTISAAISNLTRTVKNIRSDIARSARRRSLLRTFHSKSDKDKISEWKQELNRLMALFTAELQVVIGVSVEDIRDKLVTVHHDISDKLDDMHQDVKALVARDLRKDPGPQDVFPTGEHTPPPPKLFFGRESLVTSTAESLKNGHAALIGPGGIGKTSIAKTILHHPSIKDRFGTNIFFVKCDDLIVSRDNFLNRIGKTIGARMSQSDPVQSLRAHFSSCSKPLLLVLDNAETVLDAATDRAQISEFMDELVSFSNVYILLTTRTTMLPNNTGWCRIQVPPLDAHAAREAFYAVFNDQGSPETRVIDNLLEEVDRHPLSINLLAWAATQNDWSISELYERWEAQNTRVLDFGDDGGRLQSLSVSIELSLNSPSMRKLGESAKHILQVIAFLPQGVDHSKLSRLFPSIANIQLIVDTTRKMSLTYRSNGFITMLAPIRLHLSHAAPSELPLLKDVQTFYFGALEECRDLIPGDEGFPKGAWITSEDDNVEGLIVRSDDSLDTSYACSDFLEILHWHKPRKTTLGAKIRRFPEGDDESARLKLCCLRNVGLTAMEMGGFMDATEIFTVARSLALSRNDQVVATHLLTDLAEVSYWLGNLPDAESQYSEALALFQEYEYRDGEAQCNQKLGLVMREQGNLSRASEFLEKALEYFEMMQDRRKVGATRIYLGSIASYNGNHSEARKHYEAGVTVFTDLDDRHGVGLCLKYYAEMEQSLKHWTEAHHYLERAQRSYVAANSIREAADCLLKRGYTYAMQKEFSLAEEYVRRADQIFIGIGSSRDHARCTYNFAFIERNQGRFKNAIPLYTEARDLFAEIGDLLTHASCSAALGYIGFMEKDYIAAEKSFREAKCKYEAAGFSPKQIKQKFDGVAGWQWFEETHRLRSGG